MRILLSILPDVLGPDLKIVFCGTAAGRKSADLGYYYAGNGNKFWKTLFSTGLTPRLLLPSEFRELIAWGIGLTDMVKDKSGMDSSLTRSDFRNNGLVEKIRKYSPKILCFNGKKAAKEFYGYDRVEYGLQEKGVYDTRIFIAPSTSGAANGYWDINRWVELKNLINEC